MPQILNVTTDERFSSANSEEIIQNANNPGKTSSSIPVKAPRASDKVPNPSIISYGPSIVNAIAKRETNIAGVRKKSVENGLDVAGCRSRRIWVRAHLKPEKNADPIT